MNKKLFKSLTIVDIVLAALCVVLIAATIVGYNFAGYINVVLGVDTYTIVRNNEGADDIYYKSQFTKYSDMKEWQKKISAKLSEEGISLLKNDNNALPLAKGSKINTIGYFATNLARGGSGSGFVDVDTIDGVTYASDLLTGLETNNYFDVNDDLYNFYKTQEGTTSISTITEPTVSAETIKSYCTGDFANGAVGIVVIKREGGEGNDLYAYGGGNTRAGVEGNVLALDSSEIALLDEIKKLKDDGVLSKVVMLLNSPNAIQMDFLKIENGKYNSIVDAIVNIGGVGHYGTLGIGKVLCGDANFSGRIVDTIAYDNRTNPAVQNFGTTVFDNAAAKGVAESSTQNYVFYAENIYVGYKYYETRYEDYVLGQGSAGTFDYKNTIAYPFGFGESYTTWEYTDVSGKKVGEGRDAKFEITVTVKNAGEKAGKHTVQIYTQAPYTDYDKTNKVEKAAVKLSGFEKTGIIEPGASETITVTVSEEEIVSYDAYSKKTYILEAGDYYFSVGKNAHDAVNNILAAKGKTPANTNNRMDAEGNANAVYKWTKSGDLELKNTSYATGYEVTNLFDHSDPLLSDIGGKDKVKYLTRANWEGTMPVGTISGSTVYSKASVQLSVTDWMVKNGLNPLDEDFIEGLAKKWETETLKKDSEIILGQPGVMSLSMFKGLEYDNEAWDDLLNQLTFKEMTLQVANGFRKTDPIASIQKPGTIDHNGPVGITQASAPSNDHWLQAMDPSARRIHTGFVSGDISAATCNKQLIYLQGQAYGEDGLYTGITALFGPGSNIHRSPYSGRNFEYVSEDGYMTGVQVDYISRGMNSKGMYVYQKHALLNDQETGRNGICTFANEQSIREVYSRGQHDSFVNADKYLKNTETVEGDIFYKDFTFEKGLNWGVGIMSSYNRIGVLWTGHDYNLQQILFRKELGANGTFITDSCGTIGYTAGVAGIYGGTSLWDSNTSVEPFKDYENDARFIAGLKESVKHILFTCVNSAGMNGVSNSDSIVMLTPWWQTLLVTLDIVIGVLAIGLCAALVVLKVLKKVN